MKTLLAFGLLLIGACATPESDATFVADVAYDTVAEVGQPDEANPLFIYEVPLGLQLIDESTVLYADSKGGSLTAVDLLSGAGWQVRDKGGEGPGEFGGRQLWFSESNGVIYTASQGGQAATRSLSGELLEARRYREFIIDDQGFALPRGLLDSGVLVAHFRERLGRTLNETQELKQGFRAYSPDHGVLWSYEDVPPIVGYRERRSGNTTGSVTLSGDGVGADARHGTVAIVKNEENWLVALNADGSERARVELPYNAYKVFIDADERIWVEVWAKNEKEKTGSYIVLDRDLNTLMYVAERGVRDARGDYLVTTKRDSLDVTHIYLLKRR